MIELIKLADQRHSVPSLASSDGIDRPKRARMTRASPAPAEAAGGKSCSSAEPDRARMTHLLSSDDSGGLDVPTIENSHLGNRHGHWPASAGQALRAPVSLDLPVPERSGKIREDPEGGKRPCKQCRNRTERARMMTERARMTRRTCARDDRMCAHDTLPVYRAPNSLNLPRLT